MPTKSTIIDMPDAPPAELGWWVADSIAPTTGERALEDAVQRVGRSAYVVRVDDRLGVAHGGSATMGSAVGSAGPPVPGALPLVAFVPALGPERLGDAGFRKAHGLRYAYVAGAMAKGITSERMVEAMTRVGMIGFFGSAGLGPKRVEEAIDRFEQNLGQRPYGFNLINSPQEPELESAMVDLFLRRNVRRISASAYLKMTLPLIRYRVTGIRRDSDGTVAACNKVVAKVSRTEVARKFMSPPPEAMLRELVDSGAITTEQANLAASIPVADDVTAEADSGGHTDNRPLVTLLPTMLALRDELQDRHRFREPVRVGVGGGIATPASAAAAFAAGAAYVLTGSVNQACVEAGTSPIVRQMLAESKQADVTMAPAADMFEMGVKVQVLKWGTMFAARARKLYDLYRTCPSLEDIPQADRKVLEQSYFRTSLDQAWAQTRAFFATRDPAQIARADRDPKHKMALVFRSYLGQASGWATSGEPSRKADYQIWCGPAMGAFNEWARGSFLEAPDRRDVATVAMNLMVGAAALTRAAWLSSQGVALPPGARRFTPKTMDQLSALLADSDREDVL